MDIFRLVKENGFAALPLSINIEQDNNFYHLYSKEVPQVNGIVFDKNGNCLCYPNWRSSSILTVRSTRQLVDGIWFYVWCYAGKWYISTPTTLFARQLQIGNDFNLEQLVIMGCGSLDKLTQYLSPSFCYMFKLTSPYTYHVCDYGDNVEIWYWGRRDLHSFRFYSEKIKLGFNCRYIHDFGRGLNDDEFRNHLHYKADDDECGFVLCNGEKWTCEWFPRFARKAKMRENSYLDGAIIAKLWGSQQLDNFIKEFARLAPIIEPITTQLEAAYTEICTMYNQLKVYPRTRFILKIFKLEKELRDFLTYCYDNKVKDVGLLLKTTRTHVLASYIPDFKYGCNC